MILISKNLNFKFQKFNIFLQHFHEIDVDNTWQQFDALYTHPKPTSNVICLQVKSPQEKQEKQETTRKNQLVNV